MTRFDQIASGVLFALIVGAILLATLLVVTKDAYSQAAVPETSPFLTACKTAAAVGAMSNLKVTRCRKVTETVDGNTAFVQVTVVVPGQGKFLVTESLQMSVWSQSALNIAPAP